jgi:hypothetical protein
VIITSHHFQKNTNDFPKQLIIIPSLYIKEWIAYHYHVINLRTIIITSDPRSRTSPKHLMERWKNLIHIEYWDQSQFLDPRLLSEYNLKDSLRMHRVRQSQFNIQCLRELKRRNKGWTLVTDTDEFVRLNPRLYNEHDETFYTPDLPSIQKPGSIMAFLQDLPIPEEDFQIFSPCVPIRRIQFSARESLIDKLNKFTPTPFKASEFVTQRWRKFGSQRKAFRNADDHICYMLRTAGPAKTVIDLSRVRLVDLYNEDIEGNPHRPIESMCSKYKGYPHEDTVALFINHYLGSLEQWTYRNTDNRGEGYRLARFEDMNEHVGDQETDDIRPWLQGFIQSVGEEKALRLLENVGKLEPIPPSDNGDNVGDKSEEAPKHHQFQLGDMVLANHHRGENRWDWAHISATFSNGFYNVMFLKDCSEGLGIGPDRIKRNGTGTYTKWDYAKLMDHIRQETNGKSVQVGYTTSSSSSVDE